MISHTTILTGRLCATKTHHNDPHSKYTLELSGQQIYELQNTLEELAINTQVYDTARISVLLAEAIRTQVANQHGVQP